MLAEYIPLCGLHVHRNWTSNRCTPHADHGRQPPPAARSAYETRSSKELPVLVRLEKGRTTVVIAHRLATVQRADRIVVMDGGRIIAQDTHESLLAEGGRHAELARLRFVAWRGVADQPEEHSLLK